MQQLADKRDWARAHLRFKGAFLDKNVDELNFHELETVSWRGKRGVAKSEGKPKGDEHETGKRDVDYFAAAEEAKTVGVWQKLRNWQYSWIQEVRRENQKQASSFFCERDH